MSADAGGDSPYTDAELEWLRSKTKPGINVMVPSGRVLATLATANQTITELRKVETAAREARREAAVEDPMDDANFYESLGRLWSIIEALETP